MRDWIERYQVLMQRTWWVSASGALVMISIVVHEEFKTIEAGYGARTSVSTDPDLAFLLGKLILLLTAIGCVFAARIYLIFRERSYARISASWFVASGIAAFYVWVASPASPTPHCVEGRPCFAIYGTAASLGYVTLATALLPIVSGIRSAITFLIALGASNYK